jgi:hypothetical protein
MEEMAFGRLVMDSLIVDQVLLGLTLLLECLRK